MAKRQFTLTPAELQALQQAEKTTKQVDHLRRLQAVRLYGSGEPIAVIQTLTHASERAIRLWVEHYGQGGVEALRAQWKGGNSRKLSVQQKADVKQRLHQYRPVDLHISQNQWWTVSDLRVAVENWFGVVYKSADSYQVLLHESGFSYQRSAKVYRNKPSAVALEQFESELEKK